MSKTLDYAKKAHMEAWFRHPVLGDPSFDNFEKIGDTVHKSQPPFEWAVNGSIFSDPKTGNWYYYVALYGYGYGCKPDSLLHFIIYRSVDKGKTWENLGMGFEDFSCPFLDREEVWMGFPDVVLLYDEEDDRYILTYDWGAGVLHREEGKPSYIEILPEHGVALAWANSPEGPFYKYKLPIHNNRTDIRHLGRFDRGYSSSTIKRKNDWIVFIMQDSGPYYGWGLSCRTAKTPDGEWSEPRLLLSSDRPEYYPELLEFCFCMAFDGKVYAPATSVAGNRNYQVIFAADMEQAHHPSAWKMIREGSVWHSRALGDEKYGIWGQTLQGFIENDTFYTMYAAKDDRDYGTMSVASCPVNQLYKDGFTISGHIGKSFCPLLVAYDDFKLKMDMNFTGTVEIFLKNHGIIGPDRPESNSVTSEESFFNSVSLELNDKKEFRVLSRNGVGDVRIIGTGNTAEKAKALEVSWENNYLTVKVNGENVWTGCFKEQGYGFSPIAVCAHEFTVLNCDGFVVEGTPERYQLKYSATEAVLTGMQHSSWKPAERKGFIAQTGYLGSADKWIKWNFRGDSFQIYAPKGPDLGMAEIWVDGFLYGTADMYAPMYMESQVVYQVDMLPGEQKHAVLVRGFEGQAFAVDILEASGMYELIEEQ